MDAADALFADKINESLSACANACVRAVWRMKFGQICFRGKDINEENLYFGVIPAILRVAKDLHLPVINIHYWMLGQPGLIQGDGVHPNVKGQAFMAKVVAAKLKKVWGTIK